jgi:hypothetical protein
MFYAVIGLIVLASIGLALYALLHKSELEAQIATLRRACEEQDERYLGEVDGLRAELTKLDKIRHIPNIIEKSKKLEGEITATLAQAQKEADDTVLLAHKEVERMTARLAARVDEAQQRAFEIVETATKEANSLKQRILGGIEDDAAKAKEARRVAEWQANNVLEDARKEAKKIASQARKEAKEKTQKLDDVLARATAYALEIRTKAETRAKEIGAQAYEALKRHEFYERVATAMQNVVSGYQGRYLIPASHVLDDLAEEYGFDKAGEQLKIARERTRTMEKNGLAATCNYPEGWKRDYAINFVLSAFNGKVDSILARLKPANQGKLIQEIKDVYALANHNGEVFRNARIHEEYLDARLQELKWAVAVQRVKEKMREEQRALREQMRDEERARREIERAIKQTRQEEEAIAKAIERTRQEYESANADDRATYEAKLQGLTQKLREAEEKNQRALSMAQQTKRGNVYIISNVGSFGEDVYKIGLTRRLEPTDRVRELGDASVPFPFDIHAMIPSQDAPALEANLHRHFLQLQVNKVNRRKEFFRLKLQDIRRTMVAEAREYHESLEVDRQLQVDPEFRKRWTDLETAYESRLSFDDEEDEAEPAEEDAAFVEEMR